MANEKIIAVLKQLVKKTEAKQIIWGPTEKADVFQAAFAKATIRLSRRQPAKIQIDIFNEEGMLVESTTDEAIAGDWPSSWTFMKEMYDQARRQAMGVDVALDSLLEELGG
jgi:hypothetical protein